MMTTMTMMMTIMKMVLPLEVKKRLLERVQPGTVTPPPPTTVPRWFGKPLTPSNIGRHHIYLRYLLPINRHQALRNEEVVPLGHSVYIPTLHTPFFACINVNITFTFYPPFNFITHLNHQYTPSLTYMCPPLHVHSLLSTRQKDDDPSLCSLAQHVELELIKGAKNLAEYLDKSTFSARLIAAHAQVRDTYSVVDPWMSSLTDPFIDRHWSSVIHLLMYPLI